MLYYLLWPIFWIAFRLIIWALAGMNVEGAHRVPSSGGVIIAPNHISFADPPIIGVTVRRFAWFLATDEMFEMRILGTLAKIMRGMPIRQDSPDRAALRRTKDLLKRGSAVVIFPEGHVSRDGELQPIQAGTILLAVQTGVPVVPVGIIGSDSMMPPHQWRLRRSRSRITVKYGEPIPVDVLTGGLKGRAGLDHGALMLGRAIADLAGREPPEPEAEAGSEPKNRHRDESGKAAADRVSTCRTGENPSIVV